MTPEDILRGIYERAEETLDTSVIPDLGIRERAAYVCRCMSNRAGGALGWVVAGLALVFQVVVRRHEVNYFN